MARARNIKPSFFTNDKLAECDSLARILFIGLWTIADRAGRLENRPKKIKAEVLPYDNCDCQKLLLQLAKHGFILLYSVSDIEYIQIVNFEKHQHPHVKESESTIPAPDSHGASTVQIRPLTDSLLLNPDTHIPKTESDDFDDFWSLYPKKVAKQEAQRAYKKSLKETNHEALIAGLRKYVEANRGKDAQYIANAATWLNGKRWQDEQPPTPSRTRMPSVCGG